MNINCISGRIEEDGEIESPCDTGNWYIGSTNTVFNCYGYGCTDLGNICE